MGSRIKDRGLGAIKSDERGGAEAGAAGGVGCFDIGNFCEIAGCRSAGSNSVISSEATSGGEASACLRTFCCSTFSMWLLSIVLLATKFEYPVCGGRLMGSRFKDRELGAIEVDERGGAKAGAAGGAPACSTRFGTPSFVCFDYSQPSIFDLCVYGEVLFPSLLLYLF